MKPSNIRYLSLGLVFAALPILHCSEDQAPPAANNKPRGDGGIELPPPPDAPPGCEAAKLPSEDPCVIHEFAGVFVSASRGKADGDGSRARPLADINAALQGAKATGRRVYVCAETYDAAVDFADGGAMFGNLDCANEWKLTQQRARVGAKAAVAARAKGIAKPTRVEGFIFQAGDATEAGQSSIGLSAEDSPGLSFHFVRVAGGAGGAGAAGANATQLVQTGNINGANGSDYEAVRFLNDSAARKALFNDPKAGGVSSCGGAAAQNGGPGGAGGKGGEAVCSGILAGAICAVNLGNPSNSNCWRVNNANGAPAAAQPETAKGATSIEVAEPGAAGAAGNDGSETSSRFGATGYTTGDGTAATDGQPGQGGGGGAGVYLANACNDTMAKYGTSGSGGGAGGCPGLAGAPGKGGGASVGVFAVRSPMSFDDRCEIVAGKGGRGGRAGANSRPTAGGAPGMSFAPAGPATYNTGAPGGAGGEAGRSGHGVGGASVGLVFTGAQPKFVKEPLPGTPGDAPETLPGQLDGRAGEAKAVVSF